jgi:nucleoside 2-deoxyribosyltransferase
VEGFGVVVVNPCANRYNQRHKQLKSKDAKKELIVESQNILKPKDYQMVKMCSLIVMNLALWTPEKPMVGSIFEFGWADQLMIPVICIVGDESSPYTQHPWIKYSAAAYVETVEDAVQMIAEYFIYI